MRRIMLIVSLLLIVMVGAVGFGLHMIRRGFSARDDPSALEAYAARIARKLSIPASDGDAKNPFTPTPEVLDEARSHFADHCATCHANNGSGKTAIGRYLYPKTPDLSQPDTQSLTDGQLYYIIHNGIPLTGMPAWGDPDKDDDSWKLVLFIRHLPQVTPQEVKKMEKFNPRSAADCLEEENERQFLNGGRVPEMDRKMHH